MADESNLLAFPPRADSNLPAKADERINMLSSIGVTHESLLANLADIAQTGTKRVITKDAQGSVVKEVISEDPGVRLAATAKLLEIFEPKPKRSKRGYIEETEW